MAVADNLFLLSAGLAQISSALVFYVDSTGHAATADITADNNPHADGQVYTRHTSVREYVFFVFFSDFKKHDFLRFF